MCLIVGDVGYGRTKDMDHYIGNWLKASFAVDARFIMERDYHNIKVLYWDTYFHYVTELDYVPMDDYWYSRTYFGVHDKPAIKFGQRVWT